MKLKGTVAEKQDTTGIGIALISDEKIWTIYPVDLSCEGKYVGYAFGPDGKSYHVIEMGFNNNVIEATVRKIRKDRDKGRKL